MAYDCIATLMQGTRLTLATGSLHSLHRSWRNSSSCCKSIRILLGTMGRHGRVMPHDYAFNIFCNMHQIQTHQHPATPPHPVANLKDLAKSVPLIANKIKIALVSLTCESPKKSPPTWTECMTCAGGFRFALAHQKVYQISHWFEPHRRRHVCS